MLWYIVPLIARFAPAPIRDWLTSLVPGALAGQLAGTGNVNSVFGAVLPPATALLAMLAYAIVPLVIAAVTVDRRDV